MKEFNAEVAEKAQRAQRKQIIFPQRTPRLLRDLRVNGFPLRLCGSFRRFALSWLGAMFPPAVLERFNLTHHPLHFTRTIAPKLKAAGMSAAEIESMLVDNPRRYFWWGGRQGNRI